MNGGSQNVPEKNEPKKPGIRTMISDVREYASGKKFSLGELVSAKQERKTAAAFESPMSKIRPAIYVFIALLIIIVAAFGAFWLKRTIQGPSAGTAAESPPPIIRADREVAIELETRNQKTFLDLWQKFLDSQLRPREFIYVKTFDQSQNEFLDAKDIFNLVEITPPPLFENGMGPRSTFGIIDTALGNEPVFIIEINLYSSAFAGLLQWEEKMTADFAKLLKPDLSYDRGENVFLDSVVENNDARFLRNRTGKPIIGYSIFNKQFLIIAQSEQAVGAIIRIMSTLPPQ
ncbi:MAG: hypothetical protein HYY55_03120 [Candidatus Niyogibacteria bacterium]|nr:MAG: hypothetical protein HYY55_03120 [Candidatus Niyogibacteria bacterium]